MPPHILVVEDSYVVRDALYLLLNASGYRVTAAGSVSEAIKNTDQIDLILLDLTLPDGDGLSLIPLLRQAGLTPRHIVALTGHDDSKTRARCMDAGCCDVWIKPVPTKDLIARINRLLL